jgi:DNA mismatch repair ATPase MutS
MLRLVDKACQVDKCIRYPALLRCVHDSLCCIARVTPETRFPMPRAALRSRDVTRSCCNLFSNIRVDYQSSASKQTAKDMAPKTRSSAEGKRKREEKVKEESKTETPDHNVTNDEAKEENDEPNAEEAKGEDVKEEAQEEVKEEGTHIDLGSNSQLIPRTPNQSPQDLLTSRLAPL